MERESSRVFLFTFFIMLASDANKVMAKPCNNNLGDCQQCDERCKTKYGPTSQGSHDNTCKQCLCNNESASPASKICYSGAGLCTPKCWDECCNKTCASMYLNGVGYCDSIGHINLCKCQYPC
ncbi:unnamed protein product [Brassica oleracea]